MTLVLMYHAVEDGPAPLCVDPGLFAEHAQVIAASGAEVLTVSEVARALRARQLPERAVAITFDDGFASVVEQAAPILEEHGLRATVFCVAGHLGGENAWPTQASFAPRLSVAAPDALAALAATGWELGSHGVTHEPLDGVDEATMRREIADSRRLLEEQTGVAPTSFAWPYGARPTPSATTLIRATYDAACATGPAVVRTGSDPYALPRVDIQYLRSPDRLRRALDRDPVAYLAVRRAGGRLRRVIRPDYGA